MKGVAQGYHGSEDPVDKKWEGGLYRHPRRYWQYTAASLTVIALFAALDQIFLLRLMGPLEFVPSYNYLLFACLLSVVFILFPPTNRAPRDRVPWYDVLLFFLTVGVNGYLATQGYKMITQAYEIEPPLPVAISALILCLLVVETTRRTGGLLLTVICVFFGIYPTFADHMPGLLRGFQLSFFNTMLFHGLSPNSLLGMVTQTYGNLIIGFLLFGVMLTVTGASKAFMDFALALLGRQKGGPAKVAVVASGLFGSMSGSVISNVLTTGAFTIPTMKRCGYPPYFAAAVEACASTGGNIMPPVMGTVAFLMASILGLSYFDVVIAASIPALLYYLGIYLQIHFFSEVHDLQPLDPSEIPALRKALLEVWPYIFSILTVVFFLYLGMEGRAPFAASFVLLVLAMIKKKTRLYLRDIVKILMESAKIFSMVLGLIVGVGYIIGGFTATGVGHAFAHEVGILAGENMILLLIGGAIGCFVLGMGMTIVAVYLFVAIVVAPALVSVGVIPIAAHLFVFYWALTSFLTPPVALAAYTAAAIAGADPVKTGFYSMRLGFFLFVLPFAFVFAPALLLQTPVSELPVPLCSLVFGTILITGGFEGYLFKLGVLPLYYRMAILASGGLLAAPGWLTDLIGLGLFVTATALLLAVRKRVLGRALIGQQRR
jgi:TRAP transporter 4TM/12TM fusion protein